MHLSATLSHLRLRPNTLGEDTDLICAEAIALRDSLESRITQRSIAGRAKAPFQPQFSAIIALQGSGIHHLVKAMLFRHKFHKSRYHKPFVLSGVNGHSAGTPYRPGRLPQLTQPPKLTLFFILLFALLLGCSFAHIWKAHAVNQICIRLDSLRSRQQELLERLMTQQLIFQEITLYSKVEPLAREVLGMRPSTVKPVVIAPLHEPAVGTQAAAAVHPSAQRE